ncbi:MAG: TonB-dependent receptor, partial [Ignavibacteria bacterium]|nr:TonB-dependent receptor [Ignavibacteria bacterium]
MKKVVVLALLFCLHVFAQQVTFKSRVLDEQSRDPLYKASVVILGKTTGTFTDIAGSFTIVVEAKEDPILKISFVGYETRYLPFHDLPDAQNGVILLKKIIIPSQSIIVTATNPELAEKYSSYEKIENKKIRENYTIQDIPQYLSTSPSTYWYSEGGNGLGYNYMSIRGFDQRRIAVMVNGVPQNDPEDHNVYWLDFNDILGNTEFIQIQRGSGGAIFGAPAIGGAINIVTGSGDTKPSVTLSSEMGAYNTKKYGLNLSSGLIDNKYSFTAKLTNTSSDGYRAKAWVNFTSYYLSAVRYDEDLTSQINFYGGPFSDGLSYTGLPKFAIKDKNLRKENYSWWEGKYSYTYQATRRNEEQEQFSQPHYELLNDYKFSSRIRLNSAFFLILGNGYFDYDGSGYSYSYYRLTPENGFSVKGNPDDLYTGNTLVHAMVENKQWGWMPKMNIRFENSELTAGAEFRFHRSYHYGTLRYANGAPEELTSDFKYYEYNAGKNIVSLFGHYVMPLSPNLRFMAELQITSNTYHLYNEKFVHNDFSITNTFMNPKLGLNYVIDKNMDCYVSLAQTSREPRLKEYYDAAEASDGSTKPQFELNTDGSYNFNKPLVQPESMSNLEAGGSVHYDNWDANGNAYLMVFNDEIVKNGQLDRFGQPKTGNMNKTIHYGIELSGHTTMIKDFDITGNISISRNRVLEGTSYVKYRPYPDSAKQVAAINLSGNTIAGMPSVILSIQGAYTYQNLLAKLNLKYIGSFYSDNYGSSLSSLLAQYPGCVSYPD